MENNKFLKSLPSCKTLNQKYLEECEPISIGVWDNSSKLYGKIVTVEFKSVDGTRFWSDENILGSNRVVIISLNIT